MKTESDDIIRYKCTNCLCELPGFKFYCSPVYPISRDNHSNYCKECFSIKTKEYNNKTSSSEIHKINLVHSYELLSRIGYDVSDLENNSIHDQFMRKYEDIMSRPLKTVTDEDKKEKRRLYLKRRQMLNRS